ncbi:hypothetical protein HDV00_012588 [Rhizophlyctis rosea]|nr:hypothetical protein HDV00_012588 [Rhizophlyctis rosea]
MSKIMAVIVEKEMTAAMKLMEGDVLQLQNGLQTEAAVADTKKKKVLDRWFKPIWDALFQKVEDTFIKIIKKLKALIMDQLDYVRVKTFFQMPRVTCIDVLTFQSQSPSYDVKASSIFVALPREVEVWSCEAAKMIKVSVRGTLLTLATARPHHLGSKHSCQDFVQERKNDLFAQIGFQVQEQIKFAYGKAAKIERQRGYFKQVKKAIRKHVEATPRMLETAANRIAPAIKHFLIETVLQFEASFTELQQSFLAHSERFSTQERSTSDQQLASLEKILAVAIDVKKRIACLRETDKAPDVQLATRKEKGKEVESAKGKKDVDEMELS